MAFVNAAKHCVDLDGSSVLDSTGSVYDATLDPDRRRPWLRVGMSVLVGVAGRAGDPVSR